MPVTNENSQMMLRTPWKGKCPFLAQSGPASVFKEELEKKSNKP